MIMKPDWNSISKKEHDLLLHKNFMLMIWHALNVHDGVTICKHCKPVKN